MVQLDHVALLVPDIERAVVRARTLELTAGPIETFPGEGTRECYFGEEGRQGRLLLMQPIASEGPYARALAKRGPGLHHVALMVSELEGFLDGVDGWLVHPRCVASLPRTRTAWLARPGVGTLLEVRDGGSPPIGPPLVGVEVAAPALEALLTGLAVDGLQPSQDEATWLVAGAVRWNLTRSFWEREPRSR